MQGVLIITLLNRACVCDTFEKKTMRSENGMFFFMIFSENRSNFPLAPLAFANVCYLSLVRAALTVTFNVTPFHRLKMWISVASRVVVLYPFYLFAHANSFFL